jgi:hypothetical protein
MKNCKTLTALAVTAALLIGCVPSQYQKSVTVTKDAKGNIVSTATTESVIQRQHGNAIKFENLKGIQPE